MEDWQLLVLGGLISTVTAGVVQWWQGRQARTLQSAELAHQREQQELELAENRDRQQQEWNHERQDRLDLEQRQVLRELQGELFSLVFAAREIANQNVEIARVEKDGGDLGISVEGRNEAFRRFETSRARVYILGASAQSEEIRNDLEGIISMATSLAFTPRERHRDPDPYYHIVDERNRLNAVIGRILRGSPGLELVDRDPDPPSE